MMGDMMNIILTTIISLISVFVGAIGSWLLLKFKYRDMYSKTVSSNRMDWINNFRGEVAMIIAYLRLKKEEELEANIWEVECARAKLLTRLNMNLANPGNEYNVLFGDELEKIDFSNLNNSEEISEQLICLTRKILEGEWQRVKKEAKGEM